MPSRRSQNKPLADPLKTPKRGNRVAKPTLKAQAQQPAPKKGTAAATTAAVKKKQAQKASEKQHYLAKETAVEKEREYLAKRGFPGRKSFSKEGKIARQRHRESEAAKESAWERVERKRLQERAEHEKLVAEVGEE